MDNNPNINNNQQVPPQLGQSMMPPPPMPPRGKWQQRAMNAMGRVRDMVFPKWLPQYAIITYILALVIVSLMYSSYSLPWYYMLSGVVAVGVFFLYGSHLADRTSVLKIRREKKFEQRIFWVAFLFRSVWVFLIYTIFMQSYGDAFGFENSDTLYYDNMGQYVAGLIDQGNFHFFDEISKWNGGHDDIADMGYGIYVGFVYWLTGSNGVETSMGLGGDGGSIIAVRLLKCLWSSLTVLLIYRLAKRNFEPKTARVAAIFCALWPNFWYYCGVHLKETEMVFLVVLFVEQAELMLRSRQFTSWKVVPILIIVATIFTFRTVLGIVLILALLFAVLMSSTKVVSWGKRIIVGIFAVTLVGVIAGDAISEKASELIEQVSSDNQEKNMEWRGQREHGNSFAKYAGSAVFAPMIFTLPFPTMVQPYEGQHVQQLLNGGNYIKNAISVFTILAMVMMLLTGKWREHLLSLSFVLGYLIVLAFSAFAQSERFHQPAMPLELMYAAYGLSVAVTKPRYKRWFMYWCVLMFVAAIAWNWFKLAGRGLA